MQKKEIKNSISEYNNKELLELKLVVNTIALYLEHSHPPHIIYIPFENFPKNIERNKILNYIKKLTEIEAIISGGRIVCNNTTEQQIEIRIADDKKTYFNFLSLLNNKCKSIKDKLKKQKINPNKEKIFEGKLSTRFFSLNWGALLSRYEGKKKIFIIIVFMTALVALLIGWNVLIKSKPAFSYTMSGESFSPENKETDFPILMKFWFDGIIRNTFNTKRTLERIDYVFWNNKNLGSTYGTGYILGDLYDLGNEEDRKKIKTPLLFEPNEAKHIGISLSLNIENEENLKNKFEYECSGIYCHYESNIGLNFKDANGNIFDENGKIISEEVMGWFCFFPNKKNKQDILFAKLDICKDIIIWKTRQYLHLVKN